MPKRISKAKHGKKRRSEEPDVNQIAYRLIQKSTSDRALDPGAVTKAQISQIMRQMGKKGGKIGGKRRMETMTPEQRSQIALGAAKARWARGKRP